VPRSHQSAFALRKLRPTEAPAKAYPPPYSRSSVAPACERPVCGWSEATPQWPRFCVPVPVAAP